LLERNGMKAEDLALIEINEAFAAMPLVSTKLVAKGDPELTQRLREITNVNGGAIAIGHPMGATGARLIMTLMYELRRRGGGRGIACLCGGLAQGDGVLIEVLPE
jgi:acetyl-CoA C-acetyltransferase